MNPIEEKELAKSLFNQCWDLIDKSERTISENAEMLHLAHASRYHWGNVGTNKERAIGEWQCSHVYALLNNGPAALMHAELAISLSESLPNPNFLIASATQALAHAHFLLGNAREAVSLKSKSLQLLDGVNESDAKHIRNQIEAMPF